MGRKWCQNDPNFKVDGQLFHVIVKAFTEAERLITAGLCVTIPKGSIAELIDNSLHFNISDEWTGTNFIESENLKDQIIIEFTGKPDEADSECEIEMVTSTARDGRRILVSTINYPIAQTCDLNPPGIEKGGIYAY